MKIKADRQRSARWRFESLLIVLCHFAKVNGDRGVIDNSCYLGKIIVNEVMYLYFQYKLMHSLNLTHHLAVGNMVPG